MASRLAFLFVTMEQVILLSALSSGNRVPHWQLHRGDPVLTDCIFRNGETSGLKASGTGRGHLERCQLTAHHRAQVVIESGACPLLSNCEILQGTSHGVHIRNGGAGEFIGCTLESNQEVGLLVEDPNSNPHLKECVLTTSGGSGAVFRGTSARGVLHQCTIDNNCGYGVEIVDCANPCLTECTITNGKLHGVYATHCTGVLEGCTISNFEHDGVFVTQGASVRILYCTVHNCEGSGIHASDFAAPALEGCDIHSIKDRSVVIEGGAHPLFSQCSVRNGAFHGVHVFDRGNSTFEQCTVRDCGGVGFYVTMEGSNSQLEECTISHCKKQGLVTLQKSQCTLRRCEIFENGTVNPAHGVEIKTESHPTFYDCKIHSNSGLGVNVQDKGRGWLERTRVYNNAKGNIIVGQSSYTEMIDVIQAPSVDDD